jgi:hypothetical protein
MQAPHRPQAESDPPGDSRRTLWLCRNALRPAEAACCRIRMPAKMKSRPQVVRRA